MARISRVDRSQLEPEIAALYDKAYALRGNVPNMFRVMAHRPEIYATMLRFTLAPAATGCYKFLSFVRFTCPLPSSNYYPYTPDYALF